ncbi:MAG TPA: ABC transporter permease [Acidisphaera sp.]|nr:ABC transporter permease [Acidisphaera sp.]
MIGAATRRRIAFPLRAAALFWGVVTESVRPSTWRRTVRSAFRGALTRIVAGALGTVAVAAVIAGLGLVFEALYWLRTAAEEAAAGRILVTVLFREIAPLLVGIILLGRNGTATVAELGGLLAEDEVAILQAEGIDPFQFLVLPRVLAFAVAAFTLGTVFLLLALLSGYTTGTATGVAHASVFGFFGNVLRTMSPADLAVVPAKLLLIGSLVGLTCCATALGPRGHEGPARLLPRAFTRGVTSILMVTIALSATL